MKNIIVKQSNERIAAKFYVPDIMTSPEFNRKLSENNLSLYKYHIYYLMNYMIVQPFFIKDNKKNECIENKKEIFLTDINEKENSTPEIDVKIKVKKVNVNNFFSSFSSSSLSYSYSDVSYNNNVSISNNNKIYNTNTDTTYYYSYVFQIPVNYAKFKEKTKISTRELRRILTFLEEENIIYKVSNYAAGIKSNTYSFTQKFDYHQVENNNLKLKNNIKTYHLQQMISKGDTYMKLENIANEKFYLKLSANEYKKITNEYYQKYIDLGNDTYFSSVSDKCGRMFNYYTCLPKELRKYINHESGDPLMLIDIKNSQPYLLNYFLRDISDKEDVILYRELTTNGKIYEYLMTEMNAISEKQYTRDEIKHQCLVLFFGKRYYQNKIKDLFQDKFPNVFRVLYDLDKEKGSTHRAVILQLLESEVVLLNIGRECIENQIDILTIHDSIICQKKHMGKVIEIINRVTEEIIGISPKLHQDKI